MMNSSVRSINSIKKFNETQWIISKSAIKLINNNKNKLNSSKNKLNSKKKLTF